MKILKWIGGALLTFILGGLFMPGATHFERKIDINAPDSLVFAQVNELKNWSSWSSWYQLDPKAVYTYSDSTSGTGAFYTWSSQIRNVGSGKLTITNSKPKESIQCKMDFGGMESSASFKFMSSDNNKTQVTWAYNSDYGMNPIYRWMGLLMEGWVAPDYEKSLSNMKALCETKK